MEGLWPGVIGITGDASMYHVACARSVYGAEAVDAVVNGTGKPADREGNPLHALLHIQDDEAIAGNACDHCRRLMGDEPLTLPDTTPSPSERVLGQAFPIPTDIVLIYESLASRARLIDGELSAKHEVCQHILDILRGNPDIPAALVGLARAETREEITQDLRRPHHQDRTGQRLYTEAVQVMRVAMRNQLQAYLDGKQQ